MIEVSIRKRMGHAANQKEIFVERKFLAGSITQVLGISGIGKSTFLKMLGGLVTPDAGKIMYKNHPWFDSEARINLPPQQRLLGFVFQDYALFPNMTVREHLEFGTKDQKWISRLLDMGAVTALAAQRPIALSGGQQQRLAILRALSTKPEVLLMDEPFSALDKPLRKTLMQSLKEIVLEQKITCIVITHDPLDGFADDGFEMF